MNPRVEKAASVLIANRAVEGTELWVALYDLLADYRALLHDFRLLQGSVDGVLSAYEPGKHYDAVALASAVARLRLTGEVTS